MFNHTELRRVFLLLLFSLQQGTCRRKYNQVYFEAGNIAPANAWDDGYPSRGNYWSDFKERYPEVEDVYSGPGQNETGSDGFWDGPYNMTGDNRDNYPIVPEFPPTLVIPLLMIPSLLVAIVCRRKHVS